MEEDLTVESAISPPDLSCPKCEGLLPPELGEVSCILCDAKVRVEHPVTRRAWAEEKVACPSCNSVLISGVERRPASLQCSTCDSQFQIAANVPKTEIQCPSCERRIRMKKRPGQRDITCPACETMFRVNF